MSEQALLSSELYLHPTLTAHRVTVTMKRIIFKPSSHKKAHKVTEILFCDLIGCTLTRDRGGGKHAYMNISTMEKNKRGVRKKKTYLFHWKRFDKVETERWIRIIQWLIKFPRITEEVLLAKRKRPRPRQFLVFMNPKSGEGKSVKIFQNIVEFCFGDAGIVYETMITEYAGHCKHFSRTFDHKKYDVIVFCSGDGLVNEYINGVMEREDWDRLLKIPISVLPTGYTNSLVSSVLSKSNESYSITNALYVLLKGRATPFDMCQLETKHSKRYCFGSINWALDADIDHEADRYKKMGSARYVLGFLQMLSTLTSYEGVFEYLPVVTPATEMLKDEQRHPRLRRYTKSARASKIDNNHDESCCVLGNNGKEEKLCRSEPLDAPSVKTTMQQHERTIHCQKPIMSRRQFLHSEISNLLPDFAEPVPATWSQMDDHFVLFNMRVLNCRTSAQLSDGQMNFQLVKSDVKKINVVKMFLRLQRGEPISAPELVSENIRAFRLRPSVHQNGHLSTDGEELEYGTIQGAVLTGIASVILL